MTTYDEQLKRADDYRQAMAIAANATKTTVTQSDSAACEWSAGPADGGPADDHFDPVETAATERDLVTTGDLLDAVERFAGPFLAFPSRHCLTVLVLWVAHTWVLGAFYVTPRLVLDSPEPGSGKTRVLEILALLCRNAKLTLSTTTAALYRRIEAAEHPPTILQDEADAVFGRTSTPQAEDLRALFNAGYKRGATVDRCEGDAKNMRVKEFKVFAAVALAGLAGRMPATITDRAITMHMRRRAPDEHVAEFRERAAADLASPLRDRLEAWAAISLEPLTAARPTMPDGVRDRPAEVWEALLAVADLAGGDWPDRARAACRHFVLDTDGDELSFGARLLNDVRTIFAENDRMFSADIVSALVNEPESQWADLWGRPLDQARLAKELKRYGVRSETIRIGEGRAKGYRIDGDDGLAQAWHRYLPAVVSIPVRDTRDSRDIAGQRVTPAEARRDSRDIVTATRDTRDTAVTTETCSEQHVSNVVTPVTPVTPTYGSSDSHGDSAVRFTPPTGPGRCGVCGFHVPTQGHRDGCAANETAPC